jgi:hypothetical protein
VNSNYVPSKIKISLAKNMNDENDSSSSSSDEENGG